MVGIFYNAGARAATAVWAPTLFAATAELNAISILSNVWAQRCWMMSPIMMTLLMFRMTLRMMMMLILTTTMINSPGLWPKRVQTLTFPSFIFYGRLLYVKTFS